MFDFVRWRDFIRERAEAFKREGFSTEIRLSDHSPKPGTALDISGRNTLASFANWNTGETDWEIMDMNGNRISGKWAFCSTIAASTQHSMILQKS